jgi:hypothetical protein
MIAFARSTFQAPETTTSKSKNLKPITAESAEFLREYFAEYRHRPIRADYDQKIRWCAYTYIGLDELIKAWRDEDELVGVRPGSQSNQLVIDIDLGSEYNPHLSENGENWTEIEKIRTILLEIGLETRLFYSSDQGGIHIRAFLPELVKSIHLGAAVEYALIDAGYNFENGQLELSPRIKPYDPDPKKITLQQAFRLPLQKGGAYIGIGHDVEERLNSLDHLVEIIKDNCEEQDMQVLKAAMEVAYDRLYAANKNKKYTPTARGTAQKFKESMEDRMERGFTATGQTNELMQEVVKYGYIFLRHEGENLKDWLEQTIEELPGYRDYCGHQNEMARKAAEWQKWVENSHYYPYGGKVSSIKTSTEVKQNRNKEKAERTLNKLKLVVRNIKENFKTVTALFAKIREKAAEFTSFGTKFSNDTLYKPEYLEIWRKLLEVPPREVLHTLETSPETAKKSDPDDQPSEPVSQDYTPRPIKCLAGLEVERRQAGVASMKLILEKMRVSAPDNPETTAQPEVNTSEVIHDQPSASQLLEILQHSAPSIESVRTIWFNTHPLVKLQLGEPPKITESANRAIYNQTMMLERFKLFWEMVPSNWVKFARSWFEGLMINIHPN